jgi:transcriptional regulator with GAF, ATPase, and Fis domain/serine/threonine protein kinase/tetratricopeptide (TPR) repeat protein
MQGINLNRFGVSKILKDDRCCKTYIAFDRWLQRADLVVKLFRKASLEVEGIHREEWLASFTSTRLQHLLPIIDAGTTREGDLYLVREYYEGIPAAHPQGIEELRTLVSTVLFLRSIGFVHGALKPGNVLSSPGGIKIMDQRLPGIRRVHESEEDIRFTAPEVLEGQKPTLESDLYSIGAFAYRCLLGQHPFEDSELSQLKAKYLWSSVERISDSAGVLRRIARPIMDLLQRNPKKRTAAFRQLVDALQVKPAVPGRGPFVGRRLVLDEVRNLLRDDSKGILKAVYIEGEPGIGKTRLIEELQIRCALDDLYFACSSCGHGRGFEALGAAFNYLTKCANPGQSLVESLGPFSPTLLQYISTDTVASQGPFHGMDKISSDFVGLLTRLARSIPIVLIIEDVQEASPPLIHFIKQLCLRAAELPIKIICSGRTKLSISETVTILRTALGDNFRAINLGPLSTTETRRLSYLIHGPHGIRAATTDILDSNPLFLGESRRSLSEPTSASYMAVTWMLSQISGKDLNLVQILSIVQSPVTVEELAGIHAETIIVTQERLRIVQSIGLVRPSGSGVLLRQEVRTIVLKSMSRQNRLQLSRRTFEVLRLSQHPLPDVASYAFEGGAKSEASEIYRTLAIDAVNRQQYTNAVGFFKRMAQCATFNGASFPLMEKTMFAWAYHQTGKVGLARRMYREIIASEGLSHDEELLSLVQTRLAAVLDKTRPEDRIALHRAAIESLPSDSDELPKRYVQLCCSLMRIGDIPGASEAIKQAEHLLPRNPRVLLGKGLLLANKTEFAAAAHCLKAANQNDVAAANNLAICFEHLGDLRKASKLLTETHQKAVRTGHVYVEILALSNLASVKTKLGNLLESLSLSEEASSELNRLRSQDQKFDGDLLISVHADAAVHHIHSAEYKRASVALSRSKPKGGSIFALDRIFCELVHCEFYARLGQKKQVQAKLKALAGNPLFSSPFFQIEKNLLESRIGRDAPERVIVVLQDALLASEKLGTLYQRCQILNELARVSLEVSREMAGQYGRDALSLARRHGYRLLGAHALLLAGMSAEAAAQKQRYLYNAFQDASEMGLRELIAESAYQIGIFQLSQKNFVTAQEYLMRSISVIEDIAEGVPDRFRSSYIALGPHRKALQALKVCNPEVQKLIYVKSISPDFGSEKRYFASLYQLTVSANSAVNVDAVVTSIASVIGDTISRAAVVTLKHAGGHIEKTIRTKPAEDLSNRARKLIGKTSDRIHLGANQGTPQKPVAWVPLISAAFEGGIYVVCGPHERAFTEKEIEFLTIVGTVGSSALAALENRKHDDPRQNVSDFHNIIGASKAIKDVLTQIQVAATNAATVLIEGESGTGKELVARAIHEASSRSKERFMPLDCGALPESLIEAELFGAKRGAYTGADADRPGLFEAAHGGTLFLDEISNTTPALQAKLLRVIQEREVRRIGDTKGRLVDVRLIAATNQSLDALTADGRFRKDLLYRLKVLHLKVPPLRNRRDDIPMLAQAFLQRLNAANKTKKYFAPGVLDRLLTYSFPGNVRELHNATERAFFSARGTVIGDIHMETPAFLPAAGDEVQSWFNDLSEGRKDFWSAIHNKYKRRDISREKVVALVDFGLRSTRGNYKKIASMFRLKGSEYRRFMDFLRRNECLLDFRPYRKLPDSPNT